MKLRNKVVSFRVTNEEKNIMKKAATKIGMNLSEYLRDIALSDVYNIPAPITHLNPPKVFIKKCNTVIHEPTPRADLLVELKNVLSQRGIIN